MLVISLRGGGWLYPSSALPREEADGRLPEFTQQEILGQGVPTKRRYLWLNL